MSVGFGRKQGAFDGRDGDIVFALYPDLRRFAAVVADFDVEPEDLVQDALLATIKKRPLHQLDDPLAYLKRVMVNLTTSNRRRSAIRRRLLPKTATPAEYLDWYPSDALALQAMSATDKAALYLAEIDGYSHDEIAELLDLSVSAVSKRLSRARTRMRQQLNTGSEPIGASI